MIEDRLMIGKRRLLVAVPALVFFVVSVLTLSHYGFIWDEPDHFVRGQAYLHYFLTGEKTYKNLDEARRSYFQNDRYTAEYFLDNDGGHPPLNDILSALSNHLFYQKLNILGDLESLHLFGVIAATFLVLVVSIFAYQTYGLLASLVSGVSLAIYPLFFAESHFNIKDPPEAAFFGATIWTFWMSIQKKSWGWLLLAVLSFSFAFSMKFNILFLPFILFPYLWVRYGGVVWEKVAHPLCGLKTLQKPYLFILITSPAVALTIFFVSWPYLWADFGRFFETFAYYTERGIATGEEAGIYSIARVNLYPILWILVTTPPWILLLAAFGIKACVEWNRKENRVSILWLLWLVVPILRVTVPHMRIYGGVRQILEYLPALALLSGLGATYLYELLQKRTWGPWPKYVTKNIWIIFFIGFLPHLLIMVKLHPNENVYFNSLIGGIKGARDRNIPYWGNSFGNAYLQAVWWLNLNAERDAKLVLLQKTDLYISRSMLRKDIQYQGGYYRSGILREGEYIIELTHQGAMHYYPYIWEYINKFLEPVYEIKADGVPIAKVWKNDKEHAKPGFLLEESIYRGEIKVETDYKALTISVPEEILLSRIIIQNRGERVCGSVLGSVQTSPDGVRWFNEEDRIHSEQLRGKTDPKYLVEFFFVGRRARLIKFLLDKENDCLQKRPQVKIVVLK